jgi:hypothetical protein
MVAIDSEKDICLSNTYSMLPGSTLDFICGRTTGLLCADARKEKTHHSLLDQSRWQLAAYRPMSTVLAIICSLYLSVQIVVIASACSVTPVYVHKLQSISAWCQLKVKTNEADCLLGGLV